MGTNQSRHPRNVPGPFYVEDGCCTACMVPHSVAPEMMGWDDEDNHCFVRKQPSGPEETYRAIQAVWVSELACLRYGGKDPEILRRFAELGEADLCDEPTPPGVGRLLRNHVTFELPSTRSSREVAERFVEYLMRREPAEHRYEVTPLEAAGSGWRLSIAWVERRFHPLHVDIGEPQTGRWSIFHSPKEKLGSLGVTIVLDDWLRSDAGATSIRWYTRAAWLEGRDEWQETPF